jgi:hypothetical protein
MSRLTDAVRASAASTWPSRKTLSGHLPFHTAMNPATDSRALSVNSEELESKKMNLRPLSAATHEVGNAIVSVITNDAMNTRHCI